MGQLGYQTQYTDPTTGDVLAQSRWYNPGTRTFRSRDTYSGNLNTPVSLNRYTYAHNNPIRYADPRGRCVELWVPACETQSGEQRRVSDDAFDQFVEAYETVPVAGPGSAPIGQLYRWDLDGAVATASDEAVARGPVTGPWRHELRPRGVPFGPLAPEDRAGEPQTGSFGVPGGIAGPSIAALQATTGEVAAMLDETAQSLHQTSQGYLDAQGAKPSAVAPGSGWFFPKLRARLATFRTQVGWSVTQAPNQFGASTSAVASSTASAGSRITGTVSSGSKMLGGTIAGVGVGYEGWNAWDASAGLPADERAALIADAVAKETAGSVGAWQGAGAGAAICLPTAIATPLCAGLGAIGRYVGGEHAYEAVTDPDKPRFITGVFDFGGLFGG